MKKLLLILTTILIAISVHAQTQTRENETEYRGLQTGSIVTISRDGNYFMVNDHNEIITHNEVNINSLWRIVYCAYQQFDWGDQNIYQFQHLSTGLYLYIEATGTGNNSRLYYRLIENNNPSTICQNNPGTGSAEAGAEYEQGRMHYYHNNTDYFMVIQNNAWGFQSGNVQSNLRVEKWTESSVTSFDSYFSPETYDFGLVKYQERDADGNVTNVNKNEDVVQTKTLRFVANKRTRTIYSRNGRQQIEQTISNAGDDENYMEKITGLSFKWQSSIGNTSTLTLSDNGYSSEGENAETGRLMMDIDNEKIKLSDDKLAYEIPIRAYGKSPLNLKHKHNANVVTWSNYVDYLVATWTYNNTTYTASARVVRKSYHTEDLPPFEYSTSPSTFTFEGDGGSQTFKINGIHQHGTAYYDVDGRIADKDYEYGPVPMPIKEDAGKLSYTFNFVEATTDNTITWLHHNYDVNHTDTTGITVTADLNNTAYRQGRLHGKVTLNRTKDDKEHEHIEHIYIPINQRVVGGENISFSHQVGKGDIQLDNNNRQQVHTAERTIYYTSGQREIKLQLAESNFFGYMRWYDYDSNGDGGDPTWNNDVNKRTTWATAPRGANGSNFKAINTSYGNSRGLYGINNDPLTQDSENNPAPLLKGWNYGEYNPETPTVDQKAKAIHTIACDVSAYTDYEITKNGNRVTSITEPTLSYRQLFHLRPAEEMAKQLGDKSHLNTPEYLENYKYRAAVGADVHLATKYRYKSYSGSHESELCYFYYNKNNELKRIGKDVQAKWFIVKNGTETEVTNPEYQVYDYLNIDSDKAETVVYVLKVLKDDTGSAETRLDHDLLIARFEVKFVNINECGPRKDAIISDHEINEHFIPLKKIDFNFGYPAPNTNNVTQLDYHLPWDQSTYGYFYPKTSKYTVGGTYIGATNSNHNDQNIPYYGEYFLVNKMDKDWAREEQHGGAANGYALYVDGTTEPGVVVSISTDAVICAGQTLYCSAWLCNPCPTSFDYNSPRNPIFRCNVEGRMKDIEGNYGEWEDISIFFVGQLPKQSGWQQIVFPVESEKSYDETRVSIYNFATGGSGNDFMVDDITLFASGLPLAAYQAQTNCASKANTESSTAAILRIDYTEFQGHRDQYMYYQIYNNTANKAIELKEAWAEDQSVSAYYHDNTADEGTTMYGSITIPRFDYTPQEGDLTFNTIQDFKDYLVDKTKESRTSHEKAYIQSFVDGQSRWLLYVMHIIPNVAKDAENINENTHLREDHSYSLRMANVAEELDAPECNMQTPLQATQATHFDLYSIEDLVEPVKKDFLPRADNVCANDLYVLKAEIKNLYAPTRGGTLQEAFGEVMGDWLVGYPFDDVYTNTTQHNQQGAIQTARESFKNTYGYYREEVTTAILYDLRRQDESNTNLLKTSFEELDANAFEHPHHYTIIKDLYEAGLLELGKTKTSFYLGSEDIARYWFFPIDGTAKATVEDNDEQDVTITLHDCSEPIWVRVSAAHSDYAANLAPITKQEKTTLQKLQLPTVRVLHSQIKGGTITIPVTEISEVSNHRLGFKGLNGDKLTLNFNALDANFHFVNIETGESIDKPTSWEIGKEYTMRLRMKIQEGNAEQSQKDKLDNGCRVGTIYFHLLILPDAVIWTPAEGSYNGWGLDENWRGWNDDGDGIIQDSEVMTTGFVPIAGSNVVIRTWGDPTLCPYIHDHNHYPLDVNAHPSKCNNIYFEPGAHIHNQHLLEYENAFVDMQITAGRWNMVSAPLQNMVSGDMYIPHEGNWQNGKSLESNNVFEVSTFQGARHTDAAYVFWQGFYNTTVDIRYEGQTDLKQASSANFVYSNALDQALQAGSGYQIYGLGPGNNGNTGSLTIRLPKQDQQYEYYDSNGQPSGKYATFNTTNRNKLAFTPNNNGVMDITLTNKVEAGSSFLFGNPTMAYIDMKAFLTDTDNAKVLNQVFYRVENSTWKSATELTLEQDRYLAPMTSVMLETKDNSLSEITIHLKPEHLTLNNHIYTIEEQSEEPGHDPHIIAQAPNRSTASEIMTIYTYAKNAHARTVLATNPAANDYYQVGEDALFVSTGIESKSDVILPLSMYTVAEQVPMMTDVRQGISQIPLSVLATSSTRSQYMQVAFYLTANWTRTCYFCDSKTGQKTRIMDGLVISVEMPLNHEQRYYIEGPDTYQGSEGVETSTTQTHITTNNKVWAYAPDRNSIVVSASDLIKSASLYDVTGRLITTSNESLITNSLTLNTAGTAGVYIVQVTLRDNTKAQTQVIVQ